MERVWTDERGNIVLDDTKLLYMLSTVNWSMYWTAYGNAAESHIFDNGKSCVQKVSSALLDLFFGDREIAQKATHDLWCSLCHQHAFISSAALPAYDILLYGLEVLDDELKVEVLDIFMGFAVCTTKGPLMPWQAYLRTKLERDRSIFQRLSTHLNEDIGIFACNIIEELDFLENSEEIIV